MYKKILFKILRNYIYSTKMGEDIIKIAKESLENLLNLIQEKYENIDVDLIDNVLNIETSDDQVLIVSLHEPTYQIWYSSPLSGALHFRFEEKKNTWVNTRNDVQEFPKIVLDEINTIEK